MSGSLPRVSTLLLLATLMSPVEALVAGWAHLPSSAVAAQDTTEIDPQEELRLLREAAGLEWRGRTDAAEGVLTGLLERWPTSSGGLFALERILRSRSRIGLVLPYVDAHLAANPSASGIRFMKLRVLVEVDSLSALEETAEAWFNAEPDTPEPWREVSRVYGRAFGDDAALEVLERGREALDADDDPLSMEIGDLRASVGDREGAVEEWSRGVRRPDVDPGSILPRVARFGDAAASLSGPLFEALTAESAGFELRETAVRLAILLGDADRARALALETLPDIQPPERIDLLTDVAQRADEAGLDQLELWALREQRMRMGNRDARTLDLRIASAALAVGDTVTALEAQTRLARALPPGSVERRRVIADLIRVEATNASPATLRQRLSGFASEFPAAPELDELTALVSSSLAGRGDREGALEVLATSGGARSGLEGAYLHFADGDLVEGRVALEEALPALPPSSATEGIQLLALLDRVGPESGLALAAAAAKEHWGDAEAAAEALALVADTAPEEDRAALWAQAARWAEAAGRADRAAAWFSVVVAGFGDAPEHPEAIYRLARIRAASDSGLAEARALLEQLILDRPNSPVVPAARRELQRIGRAQR